MLLKLFFLLLIFIAPLYAASSATCTPPSSDPDVGGLLGKRKTPDDKTKVDDSIERFHVPIEVLSEQVQTWCSSLQKIELLTEIGLVPSDVAISGDHGVGKTWQIKQVAEMLGASFCEASGYAIAAENSKQENKLAAYNAWVAERYKELQNQNTKIAMLVISRFSAILQQPNFCLSNAMQHVNRLRQVALEENGVHLIFCAEFTSNLDLGVQAYFDANLAITVPTQSQRQAFLTWKLKQFKCEDDLRTLKEIVCITDGYAGVEMHQALQAAVRELICKRELLTASGILKMMQSKKTQTEAPPYFS